MDLEIHNEFLSNIETDDYINIDYNMIPKQISMDICSFKKDMHILDLNRKINGFKYEFAYKDDIIEELKIKLLSQNDEIKKLTMLVSELRNENKNLIVKIDNLVIPQELLNFQIKNINQTLK